MSGSKLDALLAFTLPEEGGYSDDPQDPGGSTNLGVTLSTLTDYYKQMDMPAPTVATVKALTVEQVTPIYGTLFYNPLCCQQLPPGVDLQIFDFGVNAGPTRAAKMLQTALGFVPQDIDGSIGPQTLGAVPKQVTTAFIGKLHDLRVAYYKNLSDYSVFGAGWVARTDRCKAAALTMAGLNVTNNQIPIQTVLSLGSTGPAVMLLQDALKTAKLYVGYPIDGQYGQHTADAVAAYQGTHGLFADGVAGPSTLKSLKLMG